MFNDILSLNPKTDSQEKTRLIKSWVKIHWQLPDSTSILVSELQCGEQDCPDVETVIAILSGEEKKIKINKPLSSISEEDILFAKP